MPLIKEVNFSNKNKFINFMTQDEMIHEIEVSKDGGLSQNLG